MFSLRTRLLPAPPSPSEFAQLERYGYKSVGVTVDATEQRKREWVFVRVELRAPFAAMVAPLTIVFDVNGVLGYKWFDRSGSLQPITHARHNNVYFFRRPGARRLIHECRRAGHRVVLWSSMQRAFVDTFAETIIPRVHRGSVLVLCNTDAPRNEDAPEIREGRNVAILKDLNVVWDRLGIRTAAERARTIILDDDPRKTARHQRHRLHPPPFTPTSPWDEECMRDDGCLRMLDAIAQVAASDDALETAARLTM
jgi:hypothetical protein